MRAQCGDGFPLAALVARQGENLPSNHCGNKVETHLLGNTKYISSPVIIASSCGGN